MGLCFGGDSFYQVVPIWAERSPKYLEEQRNQKFGGHMPSPTRLPTRGPCGIYFGSREIEPGSAVTGGGCYR